MQIRPNAPAQGSGPASGVFPDGNTLTFPVVSGQVASDGSAGQIQLSGGYTERKNAASESSASGLCAATGNLTSISGVIIDVGQRALSGSQASITLQYPFPDQEVMNNPSVGSIAKPTLSATSTQLKAAETWLTGSSYAGLRSSAFGASTTPGSQGGPCNSAAHDFTANEPLGQASIVASGSLAKSSTGAGGHGQGSSGRRHCRPPNRIGRDRGPQISTISTHNVRCPVVRRKLKHGHLTRSGNLHTSGFHCRVNHRYQVGGTVNGAEISCRHGRRRFSFAWAT